MTRLANVAMALTALVALLLVPLASATPTESCGGLQSCGGVETASISGVILSGNVRWALAAFDVAHIGDTGRVELDTSSPQGAASTAVTPTYTVTDIVGCTQGTARNSVVNPGSFSFESYVSQFVLTDTTCSASIHVVLQAGVVPTTFFDKWFTFTIKATADMDVKDRWCDFSAWDASCTRASLSVSSWPTLNVAQSGTWTVTNAGGQTISITSWPALTGALNTTGIMYVKNPTGQTFTLSPLSGGITVTNAGGQSIAVTSMPTLNAVLSGTVNVAQSGTWSVTNGGSITLSGTMHQVIDSWPSLVASVANSGTIAIKNPTGETFAVSANVAGGLTVTNAGGQSVAITSWPELVATVHQDEACGNPTPCQVAQNVTATIMGNSTTTVLDQTGAVIQHWFPIVLVLVAIILGVYWRNLALVVVALMGIWVELAPGAPHGEMGWLFLLILAGLSQRIVLLVATAWKWFQDR